MLPKLDSSITLHEGTADIKIELKLSGSEKHAAPVIPFEVWVIGNRIQAPYVLVNPSLIVSLSPYSGNTRLELPAGRGAWSDQGGYFGGGSAAIWQPRVWLTEAMVERIDALRHPERGLKMKIQFFGTVMRGGPHPQGSRLPAGFKRDLDTQLLNDHWRALRKSWGHDETRVFEIRASSFQSLDGLPRAHSSLEKARRYLAAGEFDKVVAESRLVVEAVLRQLDYQDKSKLLKDAILVAGLPERMFDLFQTFKRIASEEHHASGADWRWRRAEARFLLHTAAALAEYMGTLGPRSGSP